MSDIEDFNTGIITEFRANDGKVGGPFEGAPLLLLHSTGAKSGASRVSPVMYRPVGDDFVVFASKAGAVDDRSHHPRRDPHATLTPSGPRAHSPVVPSSSSRVASACPAWRAVSLMRCNSTHRRSAPG